MSTYTSASIPVLALVSLAAVAGRLALRSANRGKSAEHLTAKKRARAFGESLHRNLNGLRARSGAKASPRAAPQPAAWEKAVGLSRSLSEPRFAMMKELVDRRLSVTERRIVDSALSAHANRESGGLAALRGEADALFAKLNEAVKSAHLELMQAEQEVIAEKTGESLRTLGYEVKSKSRAAGALIRGKKRDVSIAAEISEGGELQIDMAGFEDGACRQELSALRDELQKQGINIEAAHSVFHGKKEGGVLARQAERELASEFNPLGDRELRKAAGVRQQAAAAQRQRTRSH